MERTYCGPGSVRVGLISVIAAIVCCAAAIAPTARAAVDRPSTAAAARAAFESTNRGREEKKALAIARERHGLPSGVPVPGWAAEKAPHVNLTVSPAALEHAQKQGGPAGPRGPIDPDEDDADIPTGPAGPAGAAGGDEGHTRAAIRSGEVPPIRYLGGVVQHAPTVHLLFWGSNWSNTSEMLAFFQGLKNSSYQGILTQYWDSSGYISKEVTVSSHLDTRVAAPTNVNLASVGKELESAEYIWGPPNLETQYVILPAPGSTYEASFAENYCAFHDVAASGAVYAVVPYAGDEPFKEKSNCPWYGHGDATKATTVLASHEYSEMATDPLWDTAPGWRNRAAFEGEIADICATPGDALASGVMAHGLYDDHLAGCTIADANPPHVLALTEPATNVSSTAGTLNATVNPEGLPTTYQFEWGTNHEYGQTLPAAPVAVGAGAADVQVSQNLVGLQLGHVYHYRVVATNASGVTRGEDHTLIPSEWQVATPSHPLWSESWLNDVSCSSEANCLTVGYYYEPGLQPEANQALAYRKVGNGWEKLTVPQTEGEAWAELKGVSCPRGGTTCVAVGRGYVGGAYRPLIVRWNGTGWTTQHLPLPPGSFGVELNAVACVGATAGECIAVGATKNASGAWSDYSAVYSAGAWSTLTTPTSAEASDSVATDIDCRTTIASCMAVGWFNPVDGKGSRPFSLIFNQSAQWVLQTRSWRGFLEGISCRTYTEGCSAVGEQYGPVGPTVENWNGGTWSPQTTASLPDSNGGWLAAMSCRSAGDCTAVGGGFSPEHGTAIALAEHLANGKWTEQSTPRESEVAPNYFASVECVEGTCVAVGDSKATESDQALLEMGCSCHWALRNTNGSGAADAEFFFGLPGMIPVTGDWNGDGVDTAGAYDPNTGTWLLRNANTPGLPEIWVTFGTPHLVPVVGDWNGDGTDTVGVYNPANATWNLRNSNTTGPAQVSFTYGSLNMVPVVGDWNNDGVDTPGVFNPANATWALRNSNTTGSGQISFTFGTAGMAPIVGDWNKDGTDTPGVYAKATGTFNLRNSNTSGAGEVNFSFGETTTTSPLAGDWNGDGTDTVGVWK